MSLIVKSSLIVLAVMLGGWMIFDASHAFMTGHYVTPRNGEGAGQLGPWAKVVRSVGMNPNGTGMRLGFMALGIAWLSMATGFAVNADAGWLRPVGMGLAICTLWYAPIGTLLALIEFVLLFCFARPQSLT